MKTFLRILGTGASASSSKHVPSAQVFNIGNNYYMVDCGETASFWLSRFNINVCRLRKVFITHMHADHYLGLPGIIYLMDLMGAKHLQVYGPVGLKEAIEPMLKLYGHKLRMDLELIELTDGVSEVISSDDRLTVYSLPLEHSVPCIGYKFVQTDKGLEVPDEIIKEHNLDDFDIEQLEKGRLVRGPFQQRSVTLTTVFHMPTSVTRNTARQSFRLLNGAMSSTMKPVSCTKMH